MIYQIEVAEDSDEFVPFFCSSNAEEANASLKNLLNKRFEKQTTKDLTVFQILKAECECMNADEMSITLENDDSALKIKMAYRKSDEFELIGGCDE